VVAPPSGLRAVEARPAAINEAAYMDTWGSPRSDDMSSFEPVTGGSHSARPGLPGSSVSAAALHQARLARWLPASSPSPLSRVTMQGSRSPGDDKDQANRRSCDGEEPGALVSPALPLEAFATQYVAAWPERPLSC
jgi:hypothetical protein